MGNSDSTPAAGGKLPATGGMGPVVKLNVYKPAPQQQTAGTNTVSQVPGGVYHSGVVINGREYTFGGGGGGCGIVDHAPGLAYGQKGGSWIYYQTVELGNAKINSSEIQKALSDLRPLFPSSSYNLMKKNCNHFCELFCMKLGVTYPSWVNRLAKMGNTFQGGGMDFVDQHKAKIKAEEKKRNQKIAEKKELASRQSALKAEAKDGAAGAVLVQVNCPSGSKVRRRFLETDTIGDIMEFVYANDTAVKRKGFELVQRMPHMTFSNHAVTLGAAGIKGRANLFIRKL